MENTFNEEKPLMIIAGNLEKSKDQKGENTIRPKLGVPRQALSPCWYIRPALFVMLTQTY